MFQPAIAESRQIAPNAREWRFVPRDGIRFHDGSRCGAAEIVASLERVRSPERSGELGTSGGIQSCLAGARIEARTDGIVTVVTAEPMADLLDLIVDIPIISPSSSTKPTATPAGTGPYRVIDQGQGTLVAARFEHYWGQLRLTKRYGGFGSRIHTYASTNSWRVTPTS